MRTEPEVTAAHLCIGCLLKVERKYEKVAISSGEVLKTSRSYNFSPKPMYTVNAKGRGLVYFIHICVVGKQSMSAPNIQYVC